jgi:putative hydrolase of the HAD superfamily
VKHRPNPYFQYILFDLDETLYPRESGLMQTISERILLFMVHKLGFPPDDALEKKRYYFQQHGTSLRGLMVEHAINPVEYLQFVHDLNPRDFFGASPPLDTMLSEIPLRKVIFTNADIPHTERVLNTLQVRAHFEQIIDIATLDYLNKPDPLAYKKALALLGVSGERCIMVDDTARNLIPAKDVGMTTILVDGAGKTAAIDYMAPTVFQVGAILNNLLLAQGQ